MTREVKCGETWRGEKAKGYANRMGRDRKGGIMKKRQEEMQKARTRNTGTKIRTIIRMKQKEKRVVKVT